MAKAGKEALCKERIAIVRTLVDQEAQMIPQGQGTSASVPTGEEAAAGKEAAGKEAAGKEAAEKDSSGAYERVRSRKLAWLRMEGQLAIARRLAGRIAWTQAAVARAAVAQSPAAPPAVEPPAVGSVAPSGSGLAGASAPSMASRAAGAADATDGSVRLPAPAPSGVDVAEVRRLLRREVIDEEELSDAECAWLEAVWEEDEDLCDRLDDEVAAEKEAAAARVQGTGYRVPEKEAAAARGVLASPPVPATAAPAPLPLPLPAPLPSSRVEAAPLSNWPSLDPAGAAPGAERPGGRLPGERLEERLGKSLAEPTGLTPLERLGWLAKGTQQLVQRQMMQLGRAGEATDPEGGALEGASSAQLSSSSSALPSLAELYTELDGCLDRDDYAGAAALKKRIDERIGRPRR